MIPAEKAPGNAANRKYLGKLQTNFVFLAPLLGGGGVFWLRGKAPPPPAWYVGHLGEVCAFFALLCWGKGNNMIFHFAKNLFFLRECLRMMQN
jgi:hypothetical protein